MTHRGPGSSSQQRLCTVYNLPYDDQRPTETVKAAILNTMDHTPPLDGGQLPTRTQWAHDQIRLAILNGDYGPGDPLVISRLAKEMGISATPMREALANLAASGYIELQTHGKARVSKVELPEANEIYELRLTLEPQALERAVLKSNDAYRERVQAAWEALGVARVAPASVHAAFHRELLSACDSDWLLRLSTMLADRAGLLIAVGLQAPPDDYNTAEAHRVLKDLVLDGDASAAAEELRRHLSGSLAVIRGLFAPVQPPPKEDQA